MQDESRAIPTTGIHNLRDFGGYPVPGGSRLMRARLFRSGELAKATAQDWKLLRSLQLGSVFDLRGADERRDAPCQFPPELAPRVYYSDGNTAHAHAAPHVEASARALNADDARERMRRGYLSMPFRPTLIDLYSRYFHALATSPAATLIFCTAGKDRTGLAVALVQTAMGVHRDDILADYLLTNSAAGNDARVAALRKDLDERFGGKLSEDAIRVVTSVEPQYLDAAFDAIVDRHGSIGKYLAESLGVTPAVRDQLTTRLLM
jgi:protein-tyrosine phosphatase